VLRNDGAAPSQPTANAIAAVEPFFELTVSYRYKEQKA
jgi:hypothetical protein